VLAAVRLAGIRAEEKKNAAELIMQAGALDHDDQVTTTLN
jgi:hypothetical protein